MESQGAMLSISNLSKTFGGNTVLRNASLTLVPGEVHALLGQNGSGKSTIIKILSAFHEPDPDATLVVRDENVKLPLKAGDPKNLGIEFVHQNLGLVDTMSVVDNYLMGRYKTGFGGRISWRKATAECTEALRDVGSHIRNIRAPLAEVHQQADRALLAIARAVAGLRQYHGTGVLVLDEPTVYLPKEDVDRLKKTVRALAAQGNCVLYVTHRLDELPGFADKVTVLRDGVVVNTANMADVSLQQIVGMILGRELGALYPHVEHAEQAEVITVKNLKGRRINGIDFALREGEVLGVTGLVGMGYEDLPYLLWGAIPAKGGEFHFAGSSMKRPSPSKCLKYGMALLPSDRARQGGVMTASLYENLSLPVLSTKHFKRGWLRKSSEISETKRLVTEFSVTPANPWQALGRFSGGNQQKALLAKWLQRQPKVILMDEPTQGIDIGSKKDIFARIAQIASQGSAVLIASAEYEDLANICHRVLVLRDGKIVAELTREALTKDGIVHHCYLA